jgi:CRISPR/Cas system-associated endonuclease Cas1
VQTTTPDSLSIFSNSTSAPRRRGRPRVHANDSAKKAAYRQRIYERKIAALRRAAKRRLRRAPVERDLLSEAKTAYLEGDRELAISLVEQHEAQAEMAAYDHEVARS